MRYLKRFESTETVDEFIKNLSEITLELKDEGYIVNLRINRFKPVEHEIYITRPNKQDFESSASREWYKLISWYELKDTVIRIAEFSYQNGYSVRFFGDGVEFMTGFKNEIDFSGVGDDINQHAFRILITKI